MSGLRNHQNGLKLEANDMLKQMSNMAISENNKSSPKLRPQIAFSEMLVSRNKEIRAQLKVAQLAKFFHDFGCRLIVCITISQGASDWNSQTAWNFSAY